MKFRSTKQRRKVMSLMKGDKVKTPVFGLVGTYEKFSKKGHVVRVKRADKTIKVITKDKPRRLS